MRAIAATDAKAQFARLLSDVERGETICITRHGRPVARIVPEADRRQAEIDEAIASIRSRRRGKGKVTVAEILSARDEGRRL